MSLMIARQRKFYRSLMKVMAASFGSRNSKRGRVGRCSSEGTLISRGNAQLIEKDQYLGCKID